MVCDEGRASIVESAPYSSQIRGKFDMIVGNKEKNNMTSEYQKMIAGEFYRPSDPELRALAQASRQKQAAFNKEQLGLFLFCRFHHFLPSSHLPTLSLSKSVSLSKFKASRKWDVFLLSSSASSLTLGQILIQ